MHTRRHAHCIAVSRLEPLRFLLLTQMTTIATAIMYTSTPPTPATIVMSSTSLVADVRSVARASSAAVAGPTVVASPASNDENDSDDDDVLGACAKDNGVFAVPETVVRQRQVSTCHALVHCLQQQQQQQQRTTPHAYIGAQHHTTKINNPSSLPGLKTLTETRPCMSRHRCRPSRRHRCLVR